jgi:hypothetical protein
MVVWLAVVDPGPRRRAISGADDIFDVSTAPAGYSPVEAYQAVGAEGHSGGRNGPASGDPAGPPCHPSLTHRFVPTVPARSRSPRRSRSWSESVVRNRGLPGNTYAQAVLARCEPVLVAGRLCDWSGCAASAYPQVSFRPAVPIDRPVKRAQDGQVYRDGRAPRVCSARCGGRWPGPR